MANLYNEIKEAKLIEEHRSVGLDCFIIRPVCTNACCRNYVSKVAQFFLQLDVLSTVCESPEKIDPKPKPGDLLVTIASFGHIMYGFSVSMFDNDKRWKIIHVEDCLPSKWCCCGSTETFDMNDTRVMVDAIERAQRLILK